MWLLALPAISINAQKREPVDTTVDSTEEIAPPDETNNYNNNRDTSVVKKSIYFIDRRFQSSGGGPGAVESRKLPDSAIKKLKMDPDFWYVNYAFEKDEEKPEEKADTPLTETAFFQTILWLVILGGFAAFIVIYLSNSNASLFRRNNKSLDTGDDDYVETDDIFAINYQREIDKAVSNGNYRLAVRLMFLRTLKSLSDKHAINYKQDRTNFDYLMQLHSTRYYDDFFRLTRNYEYSWYGQFDLGEEKYSIIRNDFQNFDRNLK